MKTLEQQAIDDLLTMHQLPATDRDRVIAWERDTIRAMLFSKLVEMIMKDPADRTADEQSIVDQMAELVKQRRIAAAQYSIDEYTEYNLSPCTYVEPEDTGWKQDVAWCSQNPLITLFDGPTPPTLENFLTYGQAHIYSDFKNDGPAYEAASDTAMAIGLAGGLVAVGIAGATGAAIGASLTVTSALIAAIHPFLAAAIAGANTTAAISAVSGAAAAGVGAASIGALIAIVVLAIVIIVFAAIDLAAELAIPVKLNEALTDAQAGVDLRQLVQTDGGKAEIFAAFLFETLPDYAPDLSKAPVPAAQSTDRSFVLTDSAGNKTHSQTMNYQCWNVATDCKSGINHQARLSGGWFVDQDFATGQPGASILTLGIDYIDWNGDGWTAWRVGPQQFLHTRTGDESEPFLSNEIKFKTWDDSLWTAAMNQTPVAPGVPVADDTVNQGIFGLSWTAATDPDGDAVTYSLDRCDLSTIVLYPDGTSGHMCEGIVSGLTTTTYMFTEAAPEPAGNWTYRVRATDGYDVGPSSGESGTILVDRTAPVITFESHAPQSNGSDWNNTDVTLTWICDDTDPNVIFGPPSSGVVSATVSQTISSEGESQSATGTCKDNAGNISTNTQFGINIDKTAPVVEHGGPYTVDEGNTVQIEGSVSDAFSSVAEFAWYIDQVYIADIDSFDFDGLDGPQDRTVELRATDLAGNQSITQTTVTINNLAPTMTGLIAATALIATNQAFGVDISATDVPADTLNFTIDCANGITNLIPGSSSTPGVFNATGSCSYSTPGDYTIKSFATDDDGDSSATLLAATTVQIVTPKTLCVAQWGGSIRTAETCGRGETEIVLPEDGPQTLCVNQWNGSASFGSNCSRSERLVTVIGDESVSVCVNKWNGAMRVSDSCSRSERQERL